MRSEPKGELARYAFGYSDRKPGWLFWALHAAMIAYVLYAIFAASPAHACHRFSVWKYPTPQRCSVSTPQVDRSWYVEIVLPDERELAIDKLKRELAK